MNKVEKEKTWPDKKRNYKIGVGVFLFMFLFSFIIQEKKELPSLESLTNKIIETTTYFSSPGGPQEKYSLKIKFKEDDRRFEVDGTDYQNFNHKDFKKEVNSGDTVSIKYQKTLSDFAVYSFVKNGKDYCNLDQSNDHKDKSVLWLRLLTGYAFIVCLIPLFLSRQPKINYSMVLLIGLILLGIILSYTVGCECVTLTDYK